ncbi:hypothetical protein WJX81_001433 [Elliptochloris bilobata]|uniref:Geranylgeranyl transferase type-2 subunit alpha n=1 Tax=Elliptochloris bilobata TaxID=381761 RepID=A0AAW1S042_9CHLO
MHGRPRPPKDQPEDPEKQRAAGKRLALFSRLCNEVLARRAAKRYDEKSLALAGALLEQNPEVYTAWNFRREALQLALKGDAGPGEAQRLAQRELDLTEKAVRKNPKSYAAWFHRRWVVEQGLCPLDGELDLIDRLLDMDERNFHGWGYRQFITARAGVQAAAEDAYTATRIGQNFSNYSAWHARTTLLQRLHASSRTVTLDQLLAEADPASSTGESAASMVPTWALREEYGLVQQAFFTDPADQSAWLYHRWLLGGSLAHFAAASGTPREGTARQVLEEELACGDSTIECTVINW